MVWSGHRSDNTCLDDISAVSTKGLKRRGLSRFYSDRSQSFASLELVLCTSHGESTMALGKRSSSNALLNEISLMGRSVPESPATASSPSCSSGGPQSRLLGQSLSDGGGSGELYEVASDSAAEASFSSFCWPPQQADDICAALRLTSLGRGAPRQADAASSAARDISFSSSSSSCQRPHYARNPQHVVLVGASISLP